MKHQSTPRQFIKYSVILI